MKNLAYTEEELKRLCKESYSYNEVLTKAGKVKGGSNIITLKKYIELYNIDISHFTSSTAPIKKSSNFLTEKKKCQQCGVEKDPLTDFYWSNGKTRLICKECVRENAKKKYQENRQKLIQYKQTLHCKKCGENRYYLLDFHHRNPNEKDFTISDRTRTNLETIQEELDKCDVLCSNCHREWHYFFSNEIMTDYQEWLES